MAGFHLPKFRWLVIGAIAAGGWAMTQEPPKRDHWERQQQSDAQPQKAKPAADPARSTAAAPAPRPAELITSSIPKPEPKLARADPTNDDAAAVEKSKPQSLRTTEKVRMREAASTSSPVVTMVKGGQMVSVSASDGQWLKVSVGGQTGWIRSDYLTDDTAPATIEAAIPRPKADVGATAQTATTKTASAGPADMSEWGALRPARAPQGGDCQCPYDLMLNGKQCGTRSAYAKGREAACYF